MSPNVLRRLMSLRDGIKPDPHGDVSMRRADNAAGLAYFTRDRRLYELAGEDWRLNAGLGPSVIREAALRDVVTEEVRFVTGEDIAGYQLLTTTAVTLP